jgi:hypothetical protein
MRRHRSVRARAAIAVAAATALATASAGTKQPARPLAAQQLVALVTTARRTQGFRIRAKLTHTIDGSEEPEVRQLLIKGRQDGDTRTISVQVLWPPSLEGQGLLLVDGPGNFSGYRLGQPNATPLTARSLSDAFLGSDLRIEDLVEEFWSWPTQRRAGEDTVGNRSCAIVESLPVNTGAGGAVRSCISPELALPLRVDRLNADGTLARRILATRVVKQNGRWVIATIRVEPAGGGGRTILEGTKLDRDIDVPLSDLSIEQLEKPPHH